MQRFVRFLLARRALVLVLLGAITAGFLAQLPRAELSSTLTGLFFDEDSDFVRHRDRMRDFSSDEVLIVGLPVADPLSGENLERVERVVRTLESLPDVRRVHGIGSARRIVADSEGIDVRSYVDEARAHPEARDDLTEELVLDPRARGLVISGDGEHLAFAIELVPQSNRRAEAGPRFVHYVEDVFEEAGFEPDTLYRSGSSAIVSELISQTAFNLTVMLPVSMIALFVTATLLFRRLFPVLLTLSVAAIATFWTMGAAVLWSPEISVFLSVVPLFILVLSFADVVHLVNAYLLELSAGKTKIDAIGAAATDVGAACVMTSVTTFVGFAALGLVPTPIMRQLGFILAFGVSATLLVALSFVPVMLSYLPTPEARRSAVSADGRGWIDRLLGWCDRVSRKHALAVVLAFAVLTVVALVGTSRIHVDTSFVERFSASNPVQRGYRYFDENFAGSDYLSVLVDADADDGLVDPERMAALARFRDEVEELPAVDRAVSIVDVLRAVDEAMRPELVVPGGPPAPLPMSRPALAQYLLLYEMGGGDELERAIDLPRRSTQMMLRVQGLALREMHLLGDRIQALGRDILGPDTHVEVGGVFYFLGGWLDEIVDGQRRGLLFSLAMITVMMVVGLRSAPVGLLSMIPNIVPLLFLGGLLGFWFGTVDSDNLMVAMIAIGIAVDDTIHFVVRFREERRRTATVDEALHRAFHFSGRAILVTTVILVVGFLPMALSQYLSIFFLGTLLPLTVTVALAADLLLLPAMIHLGIIRYDPGVEAGVA